MEPENTVPDADLPTDTEMTLTASLTQAVGEMSLTPDGLEIATLPLNPSSSNTRQCPSSADGNWRAATTSSDRDDNTKPKSSRFQNKVSEVNVDKKPLHFKDQRDIGTFLTEQEVPAPTATKMPLTVPSELKRLLPKDEIEAMNGKHLGVKYEDSIKILNYIEYSQIKQTLFCQWLLDQAYFQNIGTEKKWKKPVFISSEGRIVDVLLTHLRKPNGWQFYAIKYQDIIFLSTANFINRQSSTLESHCGYIYREMITGGKPESETINEFHKLLSATEVTFGDHQLLIMAEMEGLDDKDDAVKIRAYKPVDRFAPLWRQKVEKSKFLKFWSVSVIPGVKTLVLGHRDKNQLLQSTNYLTMEDLWERTQFSEKQRQLCYTFTDRLLNFVKEQFTANDRFKVKLFKWKGVPRNRNNEKGVPSRGSTDKSSNPQANSNVEDSKETLESPTTTDGTKNNNEINGTGGDQEKVESPTEKTKANNEMTGGVGDQEKAEPSTTTEKTKTNDEIKDGGGDQEKVKPPQSSGFVRNREHSRPHIDLENASVICSTIVDAEEIKRVSEFILPDWFVKAAFNNQTDVNEEVAD